MSFRLTNEFRRGRDLPFTGGISLCGKRLFSEDSHLRWEMDNNLGFQEEVSCSYRNFTPHYSGRGSFQTHPFNLSPSCNQHKIFNVSPLITPNQSLQYNSNQTICPNQTKPHEAMRGYNQRPPLNSIPLYNENQPIHCSSPCNRIQPVSQPPPFWKSQQHLGDHLSAYNRNPHFHPLQSGNQNQPLNGSSSLINQIPRHPRNSAREDKGMPPYNSSQTYNQKKLFNVSPPPPSSNSNQTFWQSQRHPDDPCRDHDHSPSFNPSTQHTQYQLLNESPSNHQHPSQPFHRNKTAWQSQPEPNQHQRYYDGQRYYNGQSHPCDPLPHYTQNQTFNPSSTINQYSPVSHSQSQPHPQFLPYKRNQTFWQSRPTYPGPQIGLDDRRNWDHAKNITPYHNEKFTILSYNILAEYLVSMHYNKLYKHIPNEFLNWEWRKRSIISELGLWSADIMCLQEVDRFQDLEAALKPQGYNGIWKMRTGPAIDGCAIFWRASRFKLLHDEYIEYNKIGMRDNVAQICVLESLRQNCTRREFSLPTSSSCFNKVVVCNIHVLYNPRRGEIKLGQVRELLHRAHSVSKIWYDAPVVLCGDFNSTPMSPLYNFLSGEKLILTELDRDKISGQASAEIHVDYPHGSNRFQTSYKSSHASMKQSIAVKKHKNSDSWVLNPPFTQGMDELPCKNVTSVVSESTLLNGQHSDKRHVFSDELTNETLPDTASVTKQKSYPDGGPIKMQLNPDSGLGNADENGDLFVDVTKQALPDTTNVITVNTDTNVCIPDDRLKEDKCKSKISNGFIVDSMTCGNNDETEPLIAPQGKIISQKGPYVLQDGNFSQHIMSNTIPPNESMWHIDATISYLGDGYLAKPKTDEPDNSVLTYLNENGKEFDNSGESSESFISELLGTEDGLLPSFSESPRGDASKFDYFKKFNALNNSMASISTGEVMHTSMTMDSMPADGKNPTYDPKKWTAMDIATATGDVNCTVLQHSLKLKSTYAETEDHLGTRDSNGEPLVTSYNRHFLGTVDYIWRSDGLQTVRVLAPILKKYMQLTAGYPTERWGSDHIALASELAFSEDLVNKNSDVQ